MFSVLDHTTKTEEILVKQPSEDIQTSSRLLSSFTFPQVQNFELQVADI
jgi:hypothetical protein